MAETRAESIAYGDSLREQFVTTTRPPTEKVDTLADFLHGHVGILSSSDHVPGGARMSERSGQEFAAGLAEQHRRE